MELQHYFTSIEDIKPQHVKQSSLFENVVFYDASLNKKISNFPIAIIGIQDERNSTNKGVATASSKIRMHLYQLFLHHKTGKFLDLGNLKNGATLDDTYCALEEVVKFLLSKKIIPIIIGASQDMMYPIVKAISASLKEPNIVFFDSLLEVGESNDLHNHSFLQFIEQKIALNRLAAIGCQTYLCSQHDVDYFEKQSHSFIRLGKIREDIKKVEPTLRDADLISFDLGSIRQADALGNIDAAPNGLNAEEACQLAKYAGISERAKCFHLCECNPSLDRNDQTAQLAAQIIWHFIDGFLSRKNDYPSDSIDTLTKYVVNTDQIGYFLTFYKSQKTNRWWIEIPSDDKNTGNQIISCNYEDYLEACQNTLPDIYLHEKARQVVIKLKNN